MIMKEMKLEELWEYLDDKYQYVCFDKDLGVLVSYGEIPMSYGKVEAWAEYLFIPFNVTGIYSQNIKRPVKIEANTFGKFWNNYESEAIYGYVYYDPYLSVGSENWIKCHNGGVYKNFKPVDPASLPMRREV